MSYSEIKSQNLLFKRFPINSLQRKVSKILAQKATVGSKKTRAAAPESLPQAMLTRAAASLEIK
jgi:hypothetical protein